MNRAILNKEVQDFITVNLEKPLDKVILKGSPFEEVTIQELAQQLVSKLKCRIKLPTWYSKKTVFFPAGIHIEQSSSEQTARYKAGMVKGNLLVDLTGVLGVDSY